MRCALFLLMVSWAATGATNTLTITNRSSSSQTNYPVQIGRPFVQGEIANYPQAVIGATPIVTQADVKSRWPDGTVKHAILSFIVPILPGSGSVVVTFQNQADCNCGSGARLSKEQMLDPAFNFDALMELNQAGETITRSARTMLSNNHYAYWTEGSVATTVILADHTTKTYDLGWKRAKTYVATSIDTTATSVAVTDAAAAGIQPWDYVVAWNDKNESFSNFTFQHETARVCQVTDNTLAFGLKGMLTASGGVATIVSGDLIDWKAVGATITIDGVNYTVGSQIANSVKRFNVSGIPAYSNPVEWSICGTRSARAIDDSFHGPLNWGRNYTYVSPRDRWSTLATDGSEDQYKAFRPAFIATFWPALNKVAIRFIGEIGDTTRLQNLNYALTLKIGNNSPTTVYSNGAVSHHALGRWTKPVASDPEDSGTHRWIAGRAYYWIGDEPGPTNINHNAPYLVSTKFLPNYDFVTPNNVQATVNSRYANYWLTNPHSFMGDKGAFTFTYWGDGGLWPERGYSAAWMTWYLYTMDWKGAILNWGSADLHAASAVHFREGSSERGSAPRLYNPGTSDSALGRGLSPAARPTLSPEANGYTGYSDVAPEDKLYPIGACTMGAKQVPIATATIYRTMGGHVPDFNHTPDMQSLPYLLSGDYWYLENLQLLTSWRGASENKSARSPNKDLPGFPVSTELRNQAWGLRQFIQMAMLSPDGAPEKTFAENGVYNHIAAAEGMRDLEPSACPQAYASVCSAAWTWGNTTLKRHVSGSLKADLLDQSGSGVKGLLGQYQNSYEDSNGTQLNYGLNRFTNVYGMSSFMLGYMSATLYMTERFGYPATKLLQYIAPFYGGILDASKGAPHPWIIESGAFPIRRADWDTSYERGSVEADWGAKTDAGSKISQSQAEYFFGAQSAAIVNDNTTPAYFTQTVTSDKFSRTMFMFKLSPDFSISDGASIKIATWRNTNGGVIADAYIRRSGSQYYVRGKTYIPSDTFTYDLTDNALTTNKWWGLRFEIYAASNNYYGTSFSFSLMDPAYTADNWWNKGYASKTIASPTTFTPRPGSCDFNGGSVAHGLPDGARIVFPVTAPGGFEAGTEYFITSSPDPYKFTLSATAGGPNICPATTANVEYDAVTPALRGVNGKRITAFSIGLVEYSEGASPAGTVYFDDSMYTGNTIRLFTWEDFREAFVPTSAQMSPYMSTYREPVNQAMTGFDASSGRNPLAVDEDYGNIHLMGVAGVYPYSQQVRDNYAWFQSTVGSSSSVKANPRWAALPDGYVPTSAPYIAALLPAEAGVGGGPLEMIVTGGNFQPGALVLWGGTELTTEYLASSSLRVILTAGLLTVPGVVQVAVRNPGGETSWQAPFQVVGMPLTIDTSLLTAGSTGLPHSQTLAAHGGLPPYQWRAAEGELPPGLTLGSGGVLSGTPLRPGNWWTVLAVRSAGGDEATQGYWLTIHPELTAETTMLPPAIAGQAYTAALTAHGAVGATAWTATAAPPPGLELSTAGALAGTPTQAGDFLLQARVTDQAGRSIETARPLPVFSTGTPLEVITRTIGENGAALAYRAPGTDPCVIMASATMDFSFPLEEFSDSGGARSRLTAVTGLAPGTPHYVRVQCGTVLGQVAFTTRRSSDQPQSLLWQANLSSHRGGQTVRIDYGPTPALGSSVTANCTGTNCRAALETAGAPLLYVRWTYLNPSGQTLAASQTVLAAVR